MIDLSRVKVALFDFDDTLCIHRKADNFDIESYNVAMVKGRNVILGYNGFSS